MSDSASITSKLMEPFPVDVIEEKNGLLYIPHEIIRDRLISATGNNFDWSIDQVLFRDDGVTRRPNDRNTGEPRRPLSMIVIGTLTIPTLGKRAGIGAHPLDEGAGEDAAYKSAESDAIKRAAMAFGVGLRQLYIETGAAKRPTHSGAARQPQPSRATESQSRTRTSPTAQSAPQRTASQQQASPTIRNPDAPASDKQINYIKDLLTKNGWNPDDFILEEEEDFARISAGEASAMVDALKQGNLPEGMDVPKA